MTLESFSCADFRCLASAELDFAPDYNLIHGPNASGKTSVLEAIAYLGRGRSFRGAPADRLVRHGAANFVLHGRVAGEGRAISLGVRNGTSGLEISVDGRRGAGVSDLAERLPLQVIDPDVHDLVAGGPEERRRYLDWLAFHVEQGFLHAWRRFRKALRQRNAALREAGNPAELAGWERELATAATRVHEMRERAFGRAGDALERTGERLLGGGVCFDYRRGWREDESLEEALARGRERDRQLGTTGAGPQRADLRLSYDERQARKLVSRGQQKLLACTMILAATEVVQARLGRPLLLLLDDPAAELDGGSLERLMAAVAALDAQVVATSLTEGHDFFPRPPRTFHVEQGVVTRVASPADPGSSAQAPRGS